MKQTRQFMECAGSLTPELEGASRSASHPIRSQRIKASPQAKKGGAQHE